MGLYASPHYLDGDVECALHKLQKRSQALGSRAERADDCAHLNRCQLSSHSHPGVDILGPLHCLCQLPSPCIYLQSAKPLLKGRSDNPTGNQQFDFAIPGTSCYTMLLIAGLFWPKAKSYR
jgi:hypothetical protein